jgi:CheY-like chemotaxis protein
VAHDFNNLLTTILSFTRFVIEDLAPDDPRRADLVEVLKAADSATKLTNQLLAFSRSRPVEPQQIELNAAVGNLSRIIGRLVGSSVRVELEPAPTPICTLIDPGQLDQLLMNLATNARDAMPDGGTLKISLAADDLTEHAALPAGRYVRITVSDTGVGMTEEAQKRAFEPFFTTKGERGTGLGLATCYGIVRQAGGHVEVQSEPGKGATFSLTLPSVEPEPDGQSEVRSIAPKPVRMQGLALVVEDHAAIRRTMTRSLSEAGMQVLEAGTAEEALELVEELQARIDLLITDVVLPGKGGIQLAETMRARHSSLRVLVCSGYVGDANSGAVERLAGTDFLQKPFTGRQLVSKVAAMLG